jgi:diguanylate cyclase (GGDEF)-like protein
MTGLMNKTAMQLSVAAQLAKSDFNDCHALFMIDTDNFKSVNDTLGHGVGDDTIKFVADSIQNVFRDTDYIGRMGGDEFMVLMSHTTQEVAAERARRLNDKIRSDVKSGNESVHISCSIGIAFYARDGEDYDSLYRSADSALYEAKEAGKDGYRIYGASK